MFAQLIVIVTAILCTALNVCAQETAVPWDSAGRIYVLNQDLESQVELFRSTPGFLEARIFKIADNMYVLEVYSVSEGKQSRSRNEMTQTQLDDLLNKFRERVLLNAPSIGLDQRGRSALLWGSTLWSLFYYAPMITVAIGSEESNITTALPFLIAPVLGYVIPSALTANSDVTDGSASLALGGMFQGAIHGWAVAGVIQGENLDQQVGAALSVGVGIAESVAGFLIAKDNNLHEGQTGPINTTMFYGAAVGVFSGLLAGSDENGVEMSTRVAGAVGLVGAAGGAVIGTMLGNTGRYSPGDGGIYATMGALGATFPLAILALVDLPDPRYFFGAAILTTAGGLFIGDRIASLGDFKSSLIPVLSTLGGGVFGLGIGILTDDPDLVPMCIWGGAALGFTFAVATMDVDPDGTWRDHSGLNFSINPTGVAYAVLPTSSMSTTNVPLASLSYSFK